MFFKDNKDYQTRHLQTEWWERVKKKVWNRGYHFCYICGKPYIGFDPLWLFHRLEFHHISYERLGTEEEYKDVVIVCRVHHELCHYKWFKRLPLKGRFLTARFLSLQKQTWRRFRPSDLLNWLWWSYQTSERPREIQRLLVPLEK